MFKNITKYACTILLLLAFSVAHADDTLFSTNLYAKFQVKACTTCHDFHEQDKDGLYFNSHAKRRDVNRCQNCHNQKVTGFEHTADWFAMPGLYLSGMDAKETCEEIKEALHAKFKSDDLLAAQMEKHLFNDPRVLWAIEGATPNSGKLPFKKQEANLVKGGMEEWKTQVMAWVNGGMKCE
jgi:hypothetical protein